MGQAVVWVEFDGLTKAGDGLVQLSLVPQADANPHPSFWTTGTQGACGNPVADCRFQPLGPKGVVVDNCQLKMDPEIITPNATLSAIRATARLSSA